MGRLQKNPKRVKEVEKQVWGKSYHMISCMINNRFLERKNETCGFVTILKKKVSTRASYWRFRGIL